MDLGQLFAITVSAIFINNFVLARFLGICPYLGVSKRLDSAFSMGMAVIFVMTLASLSTWFIYTYLLSPTPSNIWFRIQGGASAGLDPKNFDLRFLRTVSFILVIASLVQFVEMFFQKMVPALYKVLGIFLPLITTNCAILGVAVLNIDNEYNLIESLVHGFAAGIGFTLVLVLMAGLREKFEAANIPAPLKGLPIAFIMAALMSIAFMGFAGLSIGG
jgi:electron transport complex protein RnfA